MSASIIHELYVKAVQASLEDPAKSGSLFNMVWEAASPETRQAFSDEILKRLATTASISVTGEVSRAIRACVELEIKRVTEQAVSSLNGTIYERTAQIWESEGVRGRRGHPEVALRVRQPSAGSGPQGHPRAWGEREDVSDELPETGIREDERKRIIAVLEVRIAGLYQIVDATSGISDRSKADALSAALELRQVVNLLGRPDAFEEYYSVHCNCGPRGPKS